MASGHHPGIKTTQNTYNSFLMSSLFFVQQRELNNTNDELHENITSIKMHTIFFPAAAVEFFYPFDSAIEI